jgi:hypothetical protein
MISTFLTGFHPDCAAQSAAIQQATMLATIRACDERIDMSSFYTSSVIQWRLTTARVIDKA